MARNPNYQKIHGVILNRKPLREADLLLTVYTKERGKIRVLGRSTRKGSSKLSGKLQQLYNVELYLAGSGIWPIVTSASIIDKYSKLRKSLSSLSLTFYAAELVYRITPDEDENPKVYNLLNKFLTEVDNHYKKIDFKQKEKVWPPILEKFRIDLLRILGHGITTRFCAHCGLKMGAGEAAAFSCFAGGVVHKDCGKSFPDTKAIEAVTAGQLALLDQQALEDVWDLSVDEDTHRCISDFVNFLLERDVHAERFLEQVKDE